MRCLVTGAAGFVGSHLSERLLGDGHEVVGVDMFHAYYPRERKERHLAALRDHERFTLHELDLRTADLRPLLDGIDVVFHEAALAGLLRSWDWFEEYMTCNVLATQRLLEAARDVPPSMFVNVSTSSVYGRVSSSSEDAVPRPISPYGATKLCAEKLAMAYHETFGLPVVCLRYFSVYGPRQRPDMGYAIFIDRVLRGEPITIFGDGEQTRGNTYVADCVEATVRAATRGRPGETYNVGGGEARSANWVVETVQRLAGRTVEVVLGPARPGEQREALADTTRARRDLGWEPRTMLEAGLKAQIDWQREQLGQ
ncbi:MAG: GDP-mannose 4,6-dehydratase [Chloroflexota bacterium]|nr:GDP-mannose 4,6-dehydratase [Chloroflexota bacterium]